MNEVDRHAVVVEILAASAHNRVEKIMLSLGVLAAQESAVSFALVRPTMYAGSPPSAMTGHEFLAWQATAVLNAIDGVQV